MSHGAQALRALVFVLLWTPACDAPVPPRTDPSVAIEPVDLGALRLDREDGTSFEAHGPVLLHFWATWCAPCRSELPSLLDAARTEGVADHVLAVSTDDDRSLVRAFFVGSVPPQVVHEPDRAAARLLGVASLPDTFLLDVAGRAVRRISGPRDWSLPEHRAWLAAALRGPSAGASRSAP